ncbi:MAG: hypothetical protein GY754_23530 [bacterium]|nr:hypothetical protein [bacterium]
MDETQKDTPEKKKKGFRISIGFKLISITSVILLFSLSLIIFLATYFFRDDSKTRIDENNLDLARIISLKVKADISSIHEKANLLAAVLMGESRTEEEKAVFSELIFKKDKDLVFIGIAGQKGKNVLSIRNSMVNRRFLRENNLSPKDLKRIINTHQKVYAKTFGTEPVIHNVSPYFKQPVIGLSFAYIKKTETAAESILIVFVRMDRFQEAVLSPGITKTFVVNGSGDVVAHHDTSLVMAKANLSKLPIVKEMLTDSSGNKHFPYVDEQGVSFLGAYHAIGFADAGVITTVEEEKAFEAVSRMQRQNALITIIVLCLAIMIVYFFAKTLTNPIKRLLFGTYEIEKENYEIEIKATTRDEIGELTESFVEMGNGLAQRERMKIAFGKFVHKDIAEMAMKGEIKLGGERKENVAIFFSDIRSFTAISEKLEPEEVVEFLNEYMTRMVDCVNKTNGTVDKFIGDAIMALWGVPVSHGNDTEDAVNASLMMRKALLDFNEGRGGKKKPLIKIGCGINTGPVVAGQIGSEDRMDYTIIGDAVNLASRVESLNKPFGTDILISEDSYKLVKDIYAVKRMQPIKVKGKTKPQQIYAVLGRKDDPQCPKSLKSLRKILGIDEKALKKLDPNAKEEKYEMVK